jgi:hypothetical protein
MKTTTTTSIAMSNIRTHDKWVLERNIIIWNLKIPLKKSLGICTKEVLTKDNLVRRD